MALDYETLDSLKRLHPAWKLLRSDHAPLVASFFHRVFIQGGQRTVGVAELNGRLEDELYRLREIHGGEAFPRNAGFYLDEWCEEDKGWLRKFYPPGAQEPVYDLTPATEKVLLWLESLFERSFVGTESRVLSVFELLRQVVEGTETDPQRRLADLEARKQALEKEIEAVKRGELSLLNETSVRDRFQLAATTARELLSDFREVEENFRRLDYQARELITRWEGAKGSLVGQLLTQREAITESDQGRNFQAFWDFLMDPQRQEELDTLLAKVYDLRAVQAMEPDPKGRRIHYSWMEAGEQTQRTVALLSQQLRRFLDNQVWLENRRIMEILKGTEQRALNLRDHHPTNRFTMELDAPAPALRLPMERLLYSPPLKTLLLQEQLEQGFWDESEALYQLRVVDRARLTKQIQTLLDQDVQTTLAEILDQFPLQEGLAELVAYLDLPAQGWVTEVDEDVQDSASWVDELGRQRTAHLNRLIYRRQK